MFQKFDDSVRETFDGIGDAESRATLPDNVGLIRLIIADRGHAQRNILDHLCYGAVIQLKATGDWRSATWAARTNPLLLGKPARPYNIVCYSNLSRPLLQPIPVRVLVGVAGEDEQGTGKTLFYSGQDFEQEVDLADSLGCQGT